MTFLYPLGLLGLIGIPVLIIIYIIKSKYTEQTVSSTYLWTLSEKFLKRRNPLSRLTGLISLILQLLAVTVISFAIAHPMIVIPDSANEYVFILDASGSMQMESGDKTRFDKGREQISTLIEEAVEGSVFTLVYVEDDASVIYDRLDDKEQALFLLNDIESAYHKADIVDAMEVAQSYFDENRSALVYLVTDTYYQTHDNLNVINVAAEEENYAVSGVSYVLGSDGKLVVNGTAVSYAGNANLTVEMYLDGGENVLAESLVVAFKGKKTPFQLTAQGVDSFTELKVVVRESDALAMDNAQYVYDVKSESSYSTLIVSERPFFLESVLATLISAEIKVVTPEEYTGQNGYGLYVFDSYTPDAMPVDGSVWIFNPEGSVPDAGFSVQGQIPFGKAEQATVSDSTASAVKNLLADLTGDDIYIKQYVKCGLYSNFTTLMTYQGNPLVFAGSNAVGNREVVFAFDLHDSNLPLLSDYMILMRNLVNYSFPDIIDQTSFYCGDEVAVNVIANCESIRVDSPSGEVSYLDTSNAVSTFIPNEVGIYTVTMTVADTERQFNIYSALAEYERQPSVAEIELSLSGEAEPGGFDGRYDPMMILFIALAVLFAADWVVYCYEKYQLR